MINVPSDNKSYKYYAFLYGLKSIDDDVLNWAIPIFIKREEYKLGKGFPYLRAMIHNANNSFLISIFLSPDVYSYPQAVHLLIFNIN